MEKKEIKKVALAKYIVKSKAGEIFSLAFLSPFSTFLSLFSHIFGAFFQKKFCVVAFFHRVLTRQLSRSGTVVVSFFLSLLICFMLMCCSVVAYLMFFLEPSHTLLLSVPKTNLDTAPQGVRIGGGGGGRVTGVDFCRASARMPHGGDFVCSFASEHLSYLITGKEQQA